ncbi:MAG: D-hydroxyproline dehydrogenase [Hyphomicrobiales bacterium]|nr:D-hydroxyproline dehydrogenase [Hyphomicrobiales bacterium]
MAQSKRIVGVIGAGMVGVTTASFLQRAGHEVFLVEPGNPGEGTSFGNAGCLNKSSVVPMSMPGTIRNVPRWLSDPMGPLVIRWSYLPTLAPWLIRFVRAGTPENVKAQARALRGLLELSVPTLMPLVKAAGAEDLVQVVGHLFVYRSEEQWRKESASWALRRDNGIVWDEFNADELRQLDPNLSREYVKGVLIRDNGHTTNPNRLVNSLADEFRRQGGRIERKRAIGFAFDGERLTGIRTENGTLAADAAVVAAGIWSKSLASELGDRIPLETERGYHLIIRDPEVSPRIPIADADGKFVATPMETGLRFAGTVELAGLAAPPNWERARMLLKHAHRMFPALKDSYPEERLSMWMGHRPSTPDSLPVIGRSRRSPDVVYAFGHGHVGMAASPMTGKIVSEIIGNQTTSIDITPFAPARFV